MNDQPSPEISSEFAKVYPYLSAEYARQDAHDASQSNDLFEEDGTLKCTGLSYADTMRIIMEANIPRKSIDSPRHRIARDTFLD